MLKEKEEAARLRREEAAREKELKKQNAEKDKQIRGIRSQAARAMITLSTLNLEIADITDHQHFKRLPKPVQTNIGKHAKQLSNWMMEADEKQKAKTPEPMTFDLNQQKDFLKDVKTNIASASKALKDLA